MRRCSLVLSASSAASAYIAAVAAAATALLLTLLRKLYDGCCTELSEKFRE